MPQLAGSSAFALADLYFVVVLLRSSRLAELPMFTFKLLSAELQALVALLLDPLHTTLIHCRVGGETRTDRHTHNNR
jgi:hypothetical protein